MNTKTIDPKNIIIGIGSLGIITIIAVGTYLLHNDAFMASQKEKLFMQYPDLNHTNIEPTDMPTPTPLGKNTTPVPTIYIHKSSITPPITPVPTKTNVPQSTPTITIQNTMTIPESR